MHGEVDFSRGVAILTVKDNKREQPVQNMASGTIVYFILCERGHTREGGDEELTEYGPGKDRRKWKNSQKKEKTFLLILEGRVKGWVCLYLRV